MNKVKVPAAALLLVLLIGAAPLTASAPLSASAAPTAKVVSTTSVSTNNNFIKVQNMDVKMNFDGVSLVPPSGQLVFIHNNTTYVPLRFMSYALQKSVAWDAKNLKVTVNEPSSSELVVIKEYLMNVTINKDTFVSKSVTLSDAKANFVFNGNAKTLPKGQSSYLVNGTLYVPLRFLSESVGNEISWDQKAMTITAKSKGYVEHINEEQANGGNTAGNVGPEPSPTVSSSPTGGSSATGKVSYEEITSATESKLNNLKSQSKSTLFSTAMEYLAAQDDASKASIIAKGKQQLASFTGSFNSIVSDAEQQLKANGYSTDIINQYRSAFESEIQNGLNAVAGMAD
ncbi:stalk domain-containing protein [Paenibacillus sp. FSL L8-0340]|uniref:stalk domain-containing protein n=1 Tax=Paenibacillus sp. FSL L8-0340 TaxID=2954685 RepID=UPI0031580DC5